MQRRWKRRHCVVKSLETVLEQRTPSAASPMKSRNPTCPTSRSGTHFATVFTSRTSCVQHSSIVSAAHCSVTKARFQFKRNARNASDCVIMETGLYAVLLFQFDHRCITYKQQCNWSIVLTQSRLSVHVTHVTKSAFTACCTSTQQSACHIMFCELCAHL